jgi:hypothetical protein
MRNAALGQGIAPPCDEIDSWRRLAESFDAAPNPKLFVGDECLGWINYRLASNQEILAAVQIMGASALLPIIPLLNPAVAGEAAQGVKDDVRAILDRCPPARHPHDTKDFLYLDQRMPATVMLWRECFPGRVVQVCSPLLDNNILDFMKSVPTRLRRQKLLYRRTIRRLFPQLFKIRRSRFSTYQAPVRRELLARRDQIEQLVRRQESLLDGIVEPDVVALQLRRLCVAKPLRTNFAHASRKAVTSALDVMRIRDLARRYIPPQAPPRPAWLILWRLLVLRGAMSSCDVEG